jgi:hypothetical protein
MDELIDAIVREHSVCWYTGKRFYTVPPEAGGLPYEFFDYSKELCQTCYDYKLDDDSVFKKVKRQGLKLAVSRYPGDTKFSFWILTFFSLYPDGIPQNRKDQDIYKCNRCLT